MRFRHYASPVGPLLIAADNDVLAYCLWEDVPDTAWPAHWTEDRDRQCRLLSETCRQLDEYFSGERETFRLPVRLAGTVFQRRVWDTLTRIPYGRTVTYKELARQTGNAKAARAAGNANRRNPLMIILPCHRVVGSNGETGGYAGGTDRKRWLLEHERCSRRGRTATAETP